MYSLNTISMSSTIGDSLPYVNSNYEVLDQWTHNIQMSAAYLWQPLIDLYNSHLIDWNDSISLMQSNSAKWISVSTTVENLSASWLKPMCVFYPDLYPVNTDLSSIKNTILLWVNQNFPVLPAYTSRPNYVEGQQLVVYNYNYYTANVINNSQTLIDQTTCYTSNGVVNVTCKNSYTGYVFCSNGDMNCAGQGSQCGYTQPVSCDFPSDGPYVLSQGYITTLTPREPLSSVDEDGNVTYTAQEPTSTTVWGVNSKNALSYIKANISIKFTDVAESINLNQFKFIVKDCQWIYVG